ncbi:MAG TPA: hypothetical protein VHK69_20750 [Chitinophagaceae bacterium]|jgi:glycosyltransferase involved in cell wall biosynthesis|nr:hypothetical protein [Chitinophagaceae bacterium]
MVIAVLTPFIQPGTEGPEADYFREVLPRLVRQHPEHRFLLLSGYAWVRGEVMPPGNWELITTAPRGRHFLFWKYWLNYTLPRLLRKGGADVLLSFSGLAPEKAGLPVCLFLPFEGHGPLSLPGTVPAGVQRWLKGPRLKTLTGQAGAVATVLPAGTAGGWVATGRALPAGGALDWEERADIQLEQTGGREYFLYTGPLNAGPDLVGLLKAYSLFKKRQKSGLKLVLAGPAGSGAEALKSLLGTYKYRDDVQVLHPAPGVKADLVSAAYALVRLRDGGAGAEDAPFAFRSDVPVLAASGSAAARFGEEAVRVFGPEDGGEALMEVYRDERRRARLIGAGRAAVADWSWETAADRLWIAVQEAAQR